MRISTRCRYGIRMLLDIAIHSNNGPIRTQDIAERERLPLKYLEKLVRLLKDAELVSSKRGPGGGHVLIREPQTITFGELIRILEGKEEIIDCFEEGDGHETVPSYAANIFWDKVNYKLTDLMDSMTLADIMEEGLQYNELKKLQTNTPTAN